MFRLLIELNIQSGFQDHINIIIISTSYGRSSMYVREHRKVMVNSAK